MPSWQPSAYSGQSEHSFRLIVNAAQRSAAAAADFDQLFTSGCGMRISREWDPMAAIGLFRRFSCSCFCGGVLRRERFAEGFAFGFELDAMTVMYDPVEDRIGQGGLA